MASNEERKGREERERERAERQRAAGESEPGRRDQRAKERERKDKHTRHSLLESENAGESADKPAGGKKERERENLVSQRVPARLERSRQGERGKEMKKEQCFLCTIYVGKKI